MKMKKIIVFMAILGFSFCLTQKVFASEQETSGVGDDGVVWNVVEEDIDEEGLPDINNEIDGLTGCNPEPIKPLLKSVERPVNVWNVAKKSYNFSGTSNGQTLYTNYKFKGKSGYKIYVKNYGKNPLTVKAKRLTKTYATTRISGGKSATFEFSSIKKDTEFYITFDGSKMNFKGNIK